MANRRAPTGLSPRGGRFWREITGSFELSQAELELLTEICRCLGQLDSLQEALQRDGYTVAGSTGQVQVHPAVAQLNQSRQLLSRLLSQLELPDEDGRAEVRSFSQVRASKAASVRWDLERRRHG